MTEAVIPLADTRDMIGVHQVFRDAFGSAVAYIGSVDPSDADRVEMIASFYDNVLCFLRVHHAGEDELLTPRLVERCTPEEIAEVERVAAQHQDVHHAIDEAQSTLDTWRAAPNLESATAASVALAALGGALTMHLDDEQETVLPIAARYITMPEWGELPAHGMQHFAGDKIWLIMGLIQEQMSPEQIAMMEMHMPPPVAEFWTQQGRPMFSEYVAALRA
jgi:hemerythrin-like domain-containing protein